jgi:membrane protein|tara:strand:- start:23700 stop:24956 length:1257 start_codon:yes stop_codon:yes gene_type:complete
MHAIERFTKLSHTTRAAALTYTTLFALVPLMTVLYSVLSLLPSLQQGSGEIEQLLTDNLMPASGDALMGYLQQFSQQAQKLTVVGIVLLMVTAFMMLQAIENAFNQIWQLSSGRKGLSSFLLYWAILSLGPLMLSAGFGVSSYVASLGLWKEDWVPTSGTIALAFIIPYFFSFLAFTLIYWAVPNCNVLLKHAAMGGALASLLFEIGKEVFSAATTFFPSYQLIYGAFAAVPLFLLWIYVSWVVILFSAEVVYLLGLEAEGAGVVELTEHSEQEQLLLGLQILAQLQHKQIKGEGQTFKMLQDKFQLTNKFSLRQALQLLINKKLVLGKTIKRKRRHDDLVEYFLIRDLSQYNLFQYLENHTVQHWQNMEPVDFDKRYDRLKQDDLLQELSNKYQLFEKELNTPLEEFFRAKNENKPN